MTTHQATNSTLQLFHHPASSCSRRVAITARLLELPIEDHFIELADMRTRAQLAPLNPNRKIPVLVDGDFVLWESHAIMTYLCSKVPGQTLYPTEAKARANVDRWLYWISSHLAPPVGTLNFERMIKKIVGAGAPDAEIVARNEVQFRIGAAILEAQLAQRPWVCGATMTLADISLGAQLMHAPSTQLPVAEYPNVARLAAAIQALPAWAETARAA